MKKPIREKQVITYDYLAGFKRIKDEYTKKGFGGFRVEFKEEFYEEYPKVKAIVVMAFYKGKKQKYVAVGLETLKEAKKLFKEVSKIIC